MYQIVEETSGRKAKIDSVKIGGKTGTAQKYSSEKSDDSRVLTSFVSFFPVDDSQYTMLIVFDEPSTTDVSFGLKTAAWNVVPVGGEILKEIVPILIK
jgi:cell division protein FtsI/penicillin-binding protein 2